MEKIDIGDAELAVWREGAGESVFLVSGLGGRAAFWSELVPALSSTFDVITHDHRGTGASTKSKIVYSVSQMAADVLKLMDKLDVSKAVLVGHSTGGAIAQYLAINHADRLTKIVLSATWAGPSPYFQALFKLRAQLLRDAGPEAYLVDGILRAYPPDTLSESPELLSGTPEERLAAFPGEEIELSRVTAVLDHDLRDQVSKIAIPSLVICAADDQITPVGFSYELIEKIPNAQKVILAHGGHFMPRVATSAYNAAVLSFLTEVNTES
ncbi:MAG: alpha/beta fold hydrolase [Alphaproteobacteria bacterium]|nr:alpha/beta fold hydrolase [Alphaproteobacteria bacterium]